MDNSKIPDYMLENVVQGMKNLSAADTFYKTVFERNPGAFVTAVREFLEDTRMVERMQHWTLLFRTDITGQQGKKNWRDPIGQVLHTGHFMGELASGLWRVDHYFMKELVTVDLVAANPSGDYLGKAGNRWNKYDRQERIILRNNHEGKKLLEERMQEHHLTVL